MKDVSHCVKGLLDAKTLDDTRVIDEEIYELLKKLSKSKDFEVKYRDKAAVLLDRILNFNEYRDNALINQMKEDGTMDDEKMRQLQNCNGGVRRMGRAAKGNVDYTSNGLKRRDAKN